MSTAPADAGAPGAVSADADGLESMSKHTALFSFEVDEVHPPGHMQVLGGGRVGGKARGLAYAAHHRDLDPARLAGPYARLLRIPRSVFLCSGVFEEFLEDNGLWGSVDQLPYAELRQRFGAGHFRPSRRQEFRQLLRRMRYPLAIRSSSKFEDSTDHSFAGIYLTRFIRNVGDLDERLATFEDAVRRVYASTYSDSARAYRAKRGLPDLDERMSVVVQRMVGRRHGHLVYPAVAGVAFSRNYYPWSPHIRREEGLVRLVFGLGTRAVGRNYARVVSLSHPGLRPEGHVVGDIERYSQEVFDALNVRTDELESLRLQAVAHLDPDLRALVSVVRDDYLLDDVVVARPGDRTILTLNHLLGAEPPLPFVDLMRTLLGNLESICGLPVDIEFALNMPRPGTLRPATFYLLQLRPLGVRAHHQRIRIPFVPPERVLLTGHRTMGNGHLRFIRDVVYVRPERYLMEPAAETVRTIAALNRQLEPEGYVLVGPGRWGTRNEQLGVPVDYDHINHARALVELSLAGFTPELSYGTHFFGDLFAEDLVYIPVFPEQRDRFHRDWFEQAPGRDLGRVVRWIRVDPGVGVVVDGVSSRALMYVHATSSPPTAPASPDAAAGTEPS